MRRLVPFLLGAILSTGSYAASKPKTVQVDDERNGYHARLLVTTRAFDKAQHKIHVIPNGDGACTIDGKEPFGADSLFLPDIEITSMTLLLNGERIAIPRELYSDCYRPNLDPEYFSMRINHKGTGVFVFMQAGDGAITYEAVWFLSADGSHHRYVGWTASGGVLGCPLQ